MLRAWCWAHVLCALATSRTLFQPDEHWQSLEIAHGIVFGYGYRTWEWTGHTPIRSIVHPASFVPLYALLKACGLDGDTFIMVCCMHLYQTTAPALQQALITAVGDACAFSLVQRIAGSRVAWFWVRSLLHSHQAVLHMTSLYWMFTATRTFSNTLEAAFCSMALSVWPLCAADVQRLNSRSARNGYRLALLAAFVSVLVRPTSLVMWSFLGLKLLWDARTDAYSVWRVVREPLWMAPIVLGLGACADYLYFGIWTLGPLRFFLQNVVHSVSSFYGVYAWHWYITLGIPVILSIHLPLYFFQGIKMAFKKAVSAQVRTLLGMCAWTVVVFSLLAHKEVRFLQPLVPWFHLIAALGLAKRRPSNPSSLSTAFLALPSWMRTWVYVQLPFFVYLAAFHAHAQVGVTTHLHHVASSSKTPSTVGFLMPCHSTPWQSHMHVFPWGSGGDDGRAWFLACPPPPQPHLTGYWDQSDFFLADPLQYMRTRFPTTVDLSFPPMERSQFSVPSSTGLPRAHAAYDLGWRHPWPSHLVMFSSLLDTHDHTTSMADVLTAQGYRETARFWNSVFHPEAHRRGDVVVWSHYSMVDLASRLEKVA